VRTPGPEETHFAFLRRGRPSVLFTADLMTRAPRGALRFIDPDLHDDPEKTRRSVRRLLDLPFSVLCLSHGSPIRRGPHAAIRRLLAGG
jgi:hypothetical protein